MNSKENLLENLDSKSLLNSFIREFPYKNDNFINTEEEENNIFQNIPKRNRFNSFDNNFNFEEGKKNKFYDFFDDSFSNKKRKQYLVTTLKKKDFDFSNIKKVKENNKLFDYKENSVISDEIFTSCKKISAFSKKKNDLKDLKKKIFKEKISDNISITRNSSKIEDFKDKKINLLLVKISKIGNYWKKKSFTIPNIFRLIIKNDSDNIFEEVLDYSKKEILIQDSEKKKFG